MYRRISVIHEEILKLLRKNKATYACPVSSEEMGEFLNVTPSYIREQIRVLQNLNLIGVRRGRGGGYYIKQEK